MSMQKKWRSRAEVGAIATRLLTIPVMAAALLLSYFALSSIRDEPALLADVSPNYLVSPDEASLPPRAGAANSVQPSWPAPLVSNAGTDEHEALDPSGAGRAPSP